MHSQNRGSSLKQSQKNKAHSHPPLKYYESILQIRHVPLGTHPYCHSLSTRRQKVCKKVWRHSSGDPGSDSRLTRSNGFNTSSRGSNLSPPCVQCCESSWDARPVLVNLQTERRCTMVPLRQRQGLHPNFRRRCERHRRSNGYRLVARATTRNDTANQAFKSW